jgi:hypothetical protein
MFLSFLQKSFFPRKKNPGLFQTIVIDLGAIMLWRGVWGLLDVFIFPENQALSFAISSILGIILLISIRKFYS